MGERLRIFEVGLRDGLQDEKALIPAGAKLHLFGALVEAGLEAFEITSFVSPQAVPQMADAAAIAAGTAPWDRDGRLRRTAMVINDKGYDRARAAGVVAIAIPLVASETLSVRNSRMGMEVAALQTEGLIARARADGVWVRTYVAVAWVCPFEGPTPPERVEALARRLHAAGADQIVLADTIGHAHPIEVGRLVERVGRATDMGKLGVHLHDTAALGLANAAAAIAAGVRTVDAAIGGLGGCPFAPGAAGNLATEDLVFMAEKMGFETGVDLTATWRAVEVAEASVGRTLGGRTRAFWMRRPGQACGTETARGGSAPREQARSEKR